MKSICVNLIKYQNKVYNKGNNDQMQSPIITFSCLNDTSSKIIFF